MHRLTSLHPQSISTMSTSPAFLIPARVCVDNKVGAGRYRCERTKFIDSSPLKWRRVSRSQRTLVRPCTRTRACTSSDVLSLSSLEATVADAVEAARNSIKAAADLKQVDDCRVALLGKKGSITTVMKSIGKLSPDDRPRLGVVVKEAKDQIENLLTERKSQIEQQKLDAYDDEWIDVHMPGIRPWPTAGRVHPLTSTMEIATEIFRDIGYDVIDDPEYNREIETDYYCFEALNCPPDHPARDMQDTFYLKRDKSVLLRTQTSSVQIRYMLKNKPPFKIIAPGRVFRRDAIDATHSPVFHQIELLAIDKYGVLSVGSLRATVIHFLQKMFGEDVKTRFRASYFPFTEPSMEVDVFFRNQWLEVLGCGMVDPKVMEAVGLDPKEWTGFAAGFGVERFAMVMHGITDIREFYKNDPRFLSQFMVSTDNFFRDRYRPTVQIDMSPHYAMIADEEDRIVSDAFDDDDDDEGSDDGEEEEVIYDIDDDDDYDDFDYKRFGVVEGEDGP